MLLPAESDLSICLSTNVRIRHLLKAAVDSRAKHCRVVLIELAVSGVQADVTKISMTVAGVEDRQGGLADRQRVRARLWRRDGPRYHDHKRGQRQPPCVDDRADNRSLPTMTNHIVAHLSFQDIPWSAFLLPGQQGR
jgi:hypothetical protein